MVAGMLSLPDEEAKGLHRHMGDHKRQFLSIHCTANTEDIFEMELFEDFCFDGLRAISAHTFRGVSDDLIDFGNVQLDIAH